jgi:hypothetical protein
LLLVFVGLAASWFVLWCVPPAYWTSPALRRTTRALGYAALAALVVPYAHIGRRLLLNRRAVLGIPLGNLTAWMKWHLGAAYFAFFFALLHSRAHANGWLTLSILVLLWAVMLSGVAGYFGMRACYRLLALAVEREVGLERLAKERDGLAERSQTLAGNPGWLREEDVLDWREFGSEALRKGSPLQAKLALGKGIATVVEDAIHSGHFTPQLRAEVVEKVNAQLQKADFCPPAGSQKSAAEPTESDRERGRRNRAFLESLCPTGIAKSAAPPEAVERFFDEVTIYLGTGYPSWTWLFSAQALEPVPRNHYLRVRELVSPEQRKGIDERWGFVQRRRQLDIEFWFHRLARVWLLVHGPAAWALLALVAAHVVTSIYYGGWF